MCHVASRKIFSGAQMGKKKQSRKPPTKQIRIFPDDATDLQKLAALHGEEPAITFRKVFGDLLRAHLIDAVAAEGKRLKDHRNS